MPDFDALLTSTLPQARALLTRLAGPVAEVDDLVQELWLRAHRYRDRFDPAGSMPGWLTQMAFRMFLDWRRERGRAPLPLGAAIDDLPASADSGADAREWIELRLSRLGAVERDVLLRFHRDGQDTLEIARALAMPEGTVRSHLHRARRRLAEGGA